MPNVYSAYAVENTHSHLVTSPHGAFDPWAWKNSRWRKRLMWTLLQRRAVERAECLVVTSESERRGIRSLGLRAPIAVIPLGVDVPPLLSAVVTPSSRRLVFFGRLHAKKGIDVLLRAWAGVSPRFPDWELHVIGPDDRGYAAEMQVLATTLRVQRVVFRGPIYGEQKWRELAAARLFVLPTHAENFGLAVAEALASGVPAIVTKGAPWEGLERERCGRWIEHGEDALVACLDDCLGRDPEELRAMGQRGRRWIEREFSWSLVSENTVKVYSWLIDGGATPACVRMD
jgi:glycosyltransferase involved in cell wall biosynthesis